MKRIEHREFCSWTGRRIETLEKHVMALEVGNDNSKLSDYLRARGWKEVFEHDTSHR